MRVADHILRPPLGCERVVGFPGNPEEFGQSLCHGRRGRVRGVLGEVRLFWLRECARGVRRETVVVITASTGLAPLSVSATTRAQRSVENRSCTDKPSAPEGDDVDTDPCGPGILWHASRDIQSHHLVGV